MGTQTDSQIQDLIKKMPRGRMEIESSHSKEVLRDVLFSLFETEANEKDKPIDPKEQKNFVAYRISELLQRYDLRIDKECLEEEMKTFKDVKKFRFEDWGKAQYFLNTAEKKNYLQGVEKKLEIDENGSLIVKVEPGVGLLQKWKKESKLDFATYAKEWLNDIEHFRNGFIANEGKGKGDPMSGFKDAMYDVLMTPPWVRG